MVRCTSAYLFCGTTLTAARFVSQCTRTPQVCRTQAAEICSDPKLFTPDVVVHYSCEMAMTEADCTAKGGDEYNDGQWLRR